MTLKLHVVRIEQWNELFDQKRLKIFARIFEVAKP
jgi:hypothetical protein